MDDGSTDDTAEVAARYAARVRYFFKPNAGLPAARNTGILRAAGEFIQFLDADDFLLPPMLENQMQAARLQSEASVFFCGWNEVDADGTLMETWPATPLPGDAFHTLLSSNIAPPVCFTVRRAAFENAGLFDTSLRYCEDWDMWIRLAASGAGFRAVSGKNAMYRRIPGSLSRHYEKNWRTGLMVMRRHAARHEQCVACRDAVAQGTHRWREFCFGNGFRDDLRAIWGRGNRASAVRGLLRAGARDPGLVGLLFRQAWSRRPGGA